MSQRSGFGGGWAFARLYDDPEVAATSFQVVAEADALAHTGASDFCHPGQLRSIRQHMRSAPL